MQQATVPLIEVCRQAGISQTTAKRQLQSHNPMRAPGGHHYFAPEEVPSVVALLRSSRKRNRRNVFNSVMVEGVA